MNYYYKGKCSIHEQPTVTIPLQHTAGNEKEVTRRGAVVRASRGRGGKSVVEERERALGRKRRIDVVIKREGKVRDLT